MIIGPSGAGLVNADGLEKLHESDIHAIEIPLTHNIWLKPDAAEKLSRLASRLDINVSVHAPYYINLASDDPAKVIRSRERILHTAHIASHFKNSFVVFHAGYYKKKDPNIIYAVIKGQILSLQDDLDRLGYQTTLAPETTGKHSQFGTLPELIRLHHDTGCGICVDFAHILARNRTIDYLDVINSLQHIQRFTTHYSGIEYNDKGERRHLPVDDEQTKALLQAIITKDMHFRIIIESPQPFDDALRIQQVYRHLTSRTKNIGFSD